jgi:hypothetical protein
MTQPILASAWDDFAVGFGVAAAVLVIGGIILLRWQRNRQSHELMKKAIEQGLTDDTPAHSPWQAAFRQSLMMLALGTALILLGGGAWLLASRQGDLSDLPTTQPVEELLSGPKPRDERGRLTSEGRVYTQARERLRHARTLQTASFMLTGTGVIFLMLGGVRMLIARAERNSARNPADQGAAG